MIMDGISNITVMVNTSGRITIMIRATGMTGAHMTMVRLSLYDLFSPTTPSVVRMQHRRSKAAEGLGMGIPKDYRGMLTGSPNVQRYIRCIICGCTSTVLLLHSGHALLSFIGRCWLVAMADGIMADGHGIVLDLPKGQSAVSSHRNAPLLRRARSKSSAMQESAIQETSLPLP